MLIIPYHRPFPLPDDEIKEITSKIKSVIKSGMLTNGKYVRRLEEKIKKMYYAEDAIATSNCTMGLTLCLQYLKPKEIYMPSFTWCSPYQMINNSAKLNFVDINKSTWNMIDIYPTNKDDVLWFPNHTFGNVTTYNHDDILYDGAHALGSYIPRMCIGHATVFSLAPTKLITSCEGGIVITDDIKLAEFVRDRARNCARMSEVHAIIGLATLDHLAECMRWKERVYKYYKANINGIFQTTRSSNYNTIGFLNVDNLKIPEWIETKQYYIPICDDIQLVRDASRMSNTQYVYENMACLPSWYGVDYKEIVRDIKELNQC